LRSDRGIADRALKLRPAAANFRMTAVAGQPKTS
jgi:hypothetical protein